jgi:reverse gyrase
MLEDAMRTFGRRVGRAKASDEAFSVPVAAHEAVYPCSPIKFNSSSLTGLSRLDSAIAVITRRAFASLSPDARVKTIEIEADAISSFLKKKGLPGVQVRIWKDIPETAGWLTVEKEFLRPVHIINIPLDSAIMERMVEQKIGRPSTIVGHIGKALNRGWVHGSGTLTGKGQTVLAYLQQNYPALLKPHELDRFLSLAGFDHVNHAVLAGINDVGLDFKMLQDLAREASVTAGKSFRPNADADESGLPTYAPEEDVDVVISGP